MSSSKVENNFYRFTSVGISLLDSLDELVGEGRLSPQLAMKVMQHFDKIAPEKIALAAGHSKAKIRGHIDFYRSSEEVWTFVLDEAHLWTDDAARPSKARREDITLPRLKIVATKSASAFE